MEYTLATCPIFWDHLSRGSFDYGIVERPKLIATRQHANPAIAAFHTLSPSTKRLTAGDGEIYAAERVLEWRLLAN